MDKLKTSAVLAVTTIILATGGYYISRSEPEGTPPEQVVSKEECYFIYDDVCYKTKQDVKDAEKIEYDAFKRRSDYLSTLMVSKGCANTTDSNSTE